jgi:folate-binding protein YgfZ
MVTSDEWARLESSGGLVDLTRCVKLKVTGPDALRYLNGQVSNDVRRLQPGTSLAACVCTHKGRLEALVQINRRAEDEYYVTADGALRDFLPLRLEKYLIADDAVIEDVTDQFSIVHSFGPHDPPSEGAFSFSANRIGTPGVDVWFPAGKPSGLQFSSPEALESWRIDRGVPGWETELASGILPPEARLDESAIDYHKGCYTGQEVISRLRSVGQVNRKLERLVVAGGRKVEPGWQIVSRTAEGMTSPAGTVTSAAWHPVLGTGIALGFVKRSATGGELLTGPPGSIPDTLVEIRKTLDDQRP